MNQFPALSHRLGEEADSEQDEYLCGHCDAVFKTAIAALTHRAMAHKLGHADLIRRSVIDTKCPACEVDFRSLIRVLSHLRLRQDAAAGRPC